MDFKAAIFLAMICLAFQEITLPINIKNSEQVILSDYTRRHLENNNSTFLHTDIFGDSFYYNYYYINVYIGQQKQKASLILDTGSSVMCTTCKTTCETCGNHEFDHYDSDNSDTFNMVGCDHEQCSAFPNHSTCSLIRNNNEKKCEFTIGYGEGSSYNGYVVEDIVQFGEDASQEGKLFPFGCVKKETNLFYTQLANGILGLAPIANT